MCTERVFDIILNTYSILIYIIIIQIKLNIYYSGYNTKITHFIMYDNVHYCKVKLQILKKQYHVDS